ncbi:MAG: class I poly(R)-hydroxyalkanoic acid synthase [Rhodobacteraceae bacterium]|nr:class I poly(R)-hydroxyalkanoic acid synthase [Paracoccaceae bacterium]
MTQDSATENKHGYDAEKLKENLSKINRLTERMAEALGNMKPHSPALESPDYQFYAKAAAAYFAEMMSDPTRIMQAQVSFWSESMKNWSRMQESMARGGKTPESNPSKDRRFSNPIWDQNPFFHMIRRQYELSARTIDTVTKDLAHLPDREREKVHFFAKQIVDLFAPTNFLATNPDALEKAMETNGQSLVDGLTNFVEDLEHNRQGLAVTLADPNGFEVGRDIATTKGSVVFQNRMLQLIQYSPGTDSVYKRPLLICPPWINKFYILDLRPENSFIKYCVDQGHTVFVVSWVNPDESYRDCGMDTYLEEGLLTSIDTVLDITRQPDLNVIGYCIGGTLLTCALAYLTARGEAGKINKATFLTTMTDFSEPGDLGNFLEPGFLKGITRQVEDVGFLESYFMSRTFSFLRSRDLVYTPAVRNYMMGEKPPAFDLLQWNSDSTNLPGRMAVEYLEKLYVNNELAEGEFELLGEKLRIASIRIPIYVISTLQDHIAPWKSTFKGLSRVRGERTFILSESGHIAGIVNPAAQDKYGHWTNEEPPRDPDFWFENAKFHKCSWWHGWAAWVAKGQAPDHKPRKPGIRDYKVLESAPGSYVRAK